MKTNKKHPQNSKASTGLSELQSRSEQVSGNNNDSTATPAKTDTKPSTQNAQPAWKGVFLDGPQPDQDKEGDEIPVWLVYVGNKEAEPIGTVYHVYNLARAQALARRMAQDRNLELTDEAMPA